MKKVLQISSLFFIVLSITSCDKFSDGGNKKKATENLTNVWEIDSYFFEGEDKTSELIISNFQETFADDGTYTRIYVDGNGTEVSETGTWTLDTENEVIKFSGAGPIDLTSSITSVSTSEYSIDRLKRKDLWYSFESGGNSHEFWLMPRE